MTRDILNYQGIIIGKLTLPDQTSEAQWNIALAAYAQSPESLKEIIVNKIAGFRELGQNMLDGIKADNTLAGITPAQSAQAFADYRDIILMIREGAFPSAIYALQQKGAIGFITQPMIDSWIIQLQALI